MIKVLFKNSALITKINIKEILHINQIKNPTAYKIENK